MIMNYDDDNVIYCVLSHIHRMEKTFCIKLHGVAAHL